jgi:hypothetical protein
MHGRITLSFGRTIWRERIQEKAEMQAWSVTESLQSTQMSSPPSGVPCCHGHSHRTELYDTWASLMETQGAYRSLKPEHMNWNPCSQSLSWVSVTSTLPGIRYYQRRYEVHWPANCLPYFFDLCPSEMDKFLGPSRETEHSMSKASLLGNFWPLSKFRSII